MALDIANVGKTQSSAISGTEGHVTIDGNWSAVAVIATCDCHLTFDGRAATVGEFKLPANTIMSFGVAPGPDAAGPGGGVVHFIKSTGATDGTIWISEVN